MGVPTCATEQGKGIQKAVDDLTEAQMRDALKYLAWAIEDEGGTGVRVGMKTVEQLITMAREDFE